MQIFSFVQIILILNQFHNKYSLILLEIQLNNEAAIEKKNKGSTTAPHSDISNKTEQIISPNTPHH